MSEPLIRCPHCASDIRAAATVCPHCRRDPRLTPADIEQQLAALERETAALNRKLKDEDTFMIGCITVPFVFLVIGYLILYFNCQSHGLVFARNFYGVWGCW